MRAVPGPHLVGALVGGVTGLFGARLVWGALAGLDIVGGDFVHVLLVVFLGYVGIVIGGQKGEWFEPARIIAAFRDSTRLHQYKVLDTSVIIDGRIADICETGFLEGTLVVPQFVLRELQQVADSSDSLKRNRGRRGLDILQKIQKMAHVQVQIVETDFPEVREVDLKLIELARRMNGKIVTNDFNLNKVAQLRGVPVLNINELANSLKPVVLPGEVMRVFIIKEGKEAGQGVGYLDDGTMVVVDQAKKALGRTIEVSRHERAADHRRQDDLLPLAGARAWWRSPPSAAPRGRAARPAERPRPSAPSGARPTGARRWAATRARAEHGPDRRRRTPSADTGPVDVIAPRRPRRGPPRSSRSEVPAHRPAGRRGDGRVRRARDALPAPVGAGCAWRTACAGVWGRVILRLWGVEVRGRRRRARAGARPSTPPTTAARSTSRSCSATCRSTSASSTSARCYLPVLGQYLYLGGHIGVDRGNPFRARRSLSRAAVRIRGGTSVARLPRGHAHAAATAPSSRSSAAASCWRSRRACRWCRSRSPA